MLRVPDQHRQQPEKTDGSGQIRTGSFQTSTRCRGKYYVKQCPEWQKDCMILAEHRSRTGETHTDPGEDPTGVTDEGFADAPHR